jgi:hypothetical protein
LKKTPAQELLRLDRFPDNKEGLEKPGTAVQTHLIAKNDSSEPGLCLDLSMMAIPFPAVSSGS